MLPSVECLRYIISADGIQPSPEKVLCTGGCAQTPVHISAEVVFGVAEFCNMFLPHSSMWLAPLHQLLKKNTKWSWERAQDLAFKKVKEALMSSHVLAHYGQDLPLILECDASHYRVGAVLSHEMEDSSTKPIFCKAFSDSIREKVHTPLQLGIGHQIWG